MPVLPLVAAESLAPYQRVVLHGWFDAEHEILLDNRIHAGRAGYHVLTPFLLSDAAGALASGEKMVMVNRGWLDGGVRRYPPPTIPPPPSGWLRVVGISAADSSDAFLLSPDTVAGLVHQHIDLADFAARRGLNLLPVIVIADGENAQAASAAGLVPVAVRRDYKSGRSIVYAWQWLTFAALTIVFYFILGMKKLPPQKPR